jgi:glycosyltransferase involved in cell wall biosynthesis
MKKIRVAFIKFGGLSAGGTERWLQMMAVNLPRDRFAVDYYYCDAAPYLGSNYKHANTDPDRMNYLQDNGISLIKFHVGFKDITRSTHAWVDTDFWEIFDSSAYDLVQTAKAGDKEYPYYLIDLPVVEFVALSSGVDPSPNIAYSIHPSDWQRSRWIKAGGKLEKSSVIPVPVEKPISIATLREELHIPNEAVVAGYHQRPDNNTASEIPLGAFSKIQKPNWHFIILGGGTLYRHWAKDLEVKNVHFLEASADPTRISNFLNTLDIFAHGRKDGETFGTVFAEAMIHGLPCLSHFTESANAQEETMNKGGLFAKDFEDYKYKLQNLFEDNELRTELGSFGRAYAEKFYRVEGAVKNLCEVYEKILKNENFLDHKTREDMVIARKSEIEKSYWEKLMIKTKKLFFTIWKNKK